MALHFPSSFVIFQFALVFYQLFESTQTAADIVDLEDKLGLEQQYIFNNGFSLGQTDPDEIHFHESLALLPDLVNVGKRAKSSKPRRLRSGSMERARYRGTKLKKFPESMKAGDIARLLMELAERRGISYNNKAIRYGLS